MFEALLRCGPILWMFAEKRLDEGHGGLVQLLQLLLGVAHVELGDVEKRLLLVLAQERRDSCQHHVGQKPILHISVAVLMGS